MPFRLPPRTVAQILRRDDDRKCRMGGRALTTMATAFLALAESHLQQSGDSMDHEAAKGKAERATKGRKKT
jgi:hypothetical protein